MQVVLDYYGDSPYMYNQYHCEKHHYKARHKEWKKQKKEWEKREKEWAKRHQHPHSKCGGDCREQVYAGERAQDRPNGRVRVDVNF